MFFVVRKSLHSLSQNCIDIAIGQCEKFHVFMQILKSMVQKSTELSSFFKIGPLENYHTDYSRNPLSFSLLNIYGILPIWKSYQAPFAFFSECHRYLTPFLRELRGQKLYEKLAKPPSDDTNINQSVSHFFRCALQWKEC